MRTTLSITAAITVATLGCQPAGETAQQAEARMAREGPAARTAVDPIRAGYERWTAGGHADSIAAVFTEQGRLLGPNAPASVGRDAIRASYEQQFGMGSWTLSIAQEDFVANGPLAIERGTAVLTLKPGPHAPAGMTALTDTVKYLVHFQQVNGTWLIADLIWNSNRPLPGAPAATPRRGD